MQPLTKQQAAIISAYTGYLIGEFSDMHEYVEKIMKRPVWTHFMGNARVMKEIQNLSREDFIALNPLPSCS